MYVCNPCIIIIYVYMCLNSIYPGMTMCIFQCCNNQSLLPLLAHTWCLSRYWSGPHCVCTIYAHTVCALYMHTLQVNADWLTHFMCRSEALALRHDKLMPHILAVKSLQMFFPAQVWRLKSQWIQANSEILSTWLACSSHHLISLLYCASMKNVLDFNARLKHVARVATNSGCGIAIIRFTRSYFSTPWLIFWTHHCHLLDTINHCASIVVMKVD